MKTAVYTLILTLLIGILPLNSLEEHIVVGREDRWSGVHPGWSSNVSLRQGRQGYLDIALREGEYRPDSDTDMLFHFNGDFAVDAAGKYRILEGADNVTSKVTRYGSGSAVFQRDDVMLLSAGDGSLFAPGTSWLSFSIEFWLYPGNLEEGEVIFFWQGSEQRGAELITQQMICSVRDRRLVWEFNNFFISPDGKETRITVEGNRRLVPRVWKHHLLRFDSTTGMIEYMVDQDPEGIMYASASGSEDATVYLPLIGRFSNEPVRIGDGFTGFIDELRVSSQFVENPFTSRYASSGGTVITSLFDLGYTGSQLLSVEPVQTKPGNSEIYYYYHISDIPMPITAQDPGWSLLVPSRPVQEEARGRYLQLMIKLYPDGKGSSSPHLSELTLVYEPDFPPGAPTGISADAGDTEVTLTWDPVADPDIAGYLVYYGESPSLYFGSDSNLGASPIDAGNMTSLTVTGLENEKLYFFSVVAYDSSFHPHYGDFSREVHARPSRLGTVP